jgi:hypothetical protein
MRRLRSDWADHGRQSVPIYRRELVGDKLITREIIGSTLCACFDLKSKQALRFKDTPTGNHSKRKCGCLEPYTEYKDERKMEARDNWGKRKRQDGTRIAKFQCSRCGFLISRGAVEFGKARSWGYRASLCEGCTKAMEKKTAYWRSGVRVEFEKKPA